MSDVIVRYKVKPECVDENVKLIEAVFAEMKASKISGIRYTAFQGDDTVTFIHVASIDEGIENPIAKTASFKAFQKDLADRCDEPPSPTPARVVASHN